VRDDDGILVHRRTVAGSKLHEFRGVAVVEAPIASLLGVLDDSEHRTEWMKEAVANGRIERVGAFDEIFYSRTRAPWPVADRDVVLQATTTLQIPHDTIVALREQVNRRLYPEFVAAEPVKQETP
jgi:hypothetical protein